MKFSFEIDKLEQADVDLSPTVTDTSATRAEAETTAVNAGPAPASLLSELGAERGGADAADHRDAGTPSSELLAALAAAGASSVTSASLSTNGGGAGSALDAGSAPD
jgi:hypothetical protein